MMILTTLNIKLNLIIKKRNQVPLRSMLTNLLKFIRNKPNVINNAVVSRRTINIWAASHNKLCRDYLLNHTSSSVIALLLPPLAISGLATIDDILRGKLLTDQSYAEKFVTFITDQHIRIIWLIFTKTFTEKELLQNIYNCFSLPEYPTDKDLATFYEERFISTIQHILTVLFHNKKFNLSNLPNPFNIDFSHYKDVPIGLIIEYFIFMQNIKDFPDIIQNVNGKFIDHQNPLIHEVTDIFKSVESNIQTSQKHSDLLFYRFEFTANGQITLHKIYRDIKANYRGTATGHFTLKPYISTNLDVARKFINNSHAMLSNLTNLTEPFKNTVKNDIKDIDNLQKALKLGFQKGTMKELVTKYRAKLLGMSLNSDYIKLNINFTVAADLPINNQFKDIILPHIKRNPIDLSAIDIIFPKNNKIDLIKYKQKIEDIMLSNLPPEIHHQLLINYKSYSLNDT